MRLVALVMVLGGLVARAASPEFTTYVNAARRLYEGLDYEKAIESVEKARGFSKTPDDDALLGMYEGAIRAELGQVDASTTAFKAALLLRPDIELPFRVSPKIRETVERLRAEAKAELAPLLAAQEKERLAAQKAKDEAEAKARAEARAKEEADARLKADTAKALADKAAAEQQRLAAEKKLAEVRAEQQKLDDAKKAEAQRAEKERLEKGSTKPKVVILTPPEPEVTPPPPPAPVKVRTVPVPAIVFLVAGLGAAATATLFGLQSTASVSAARAASFQSDAVTALSRAQQQATLANVMFAVTGGLGLGGLISFFVWLGERP